MKALIMRIAALAALVLAGSPTTALAKTDIVWWHAMQGVLGERVGEIAAKFNASQKDYEVKAVFKGSYPETLTAAIAAYRAKQSPHVVQVFEAGTQTMLSSGAVYPVHQLMKDNGIAIDWNDLIGPVKSYYSSGGNLASMAFNSSTPILYYNKNQFRGAGLDDRNPPKTWPEIEAAARRLRNAGVPCGFTTHWPSWVNVENFSALHNQPIATQSNGLGGINAELTINNPLLVRHIGALSNWQKTRIFDYGGRGISAEPKFQKAECGIFLGSSATNADIRANSRFEVGYGMLPYWPDVADAPQNSIIGGATLWVLNNRPTSEYKGVAKFFAFLSRPEVQATWHQNTGYLPVTRAAYDLSKAKGFYDRNPGAEISIQQITLKPPTENSKGLRLGSFVLIRDIIEGELEEAFSGRKTAKDALDAATKRGNELLRQFERANR